MQGEKKSKRTVIFCYGDRKQFCPKRGLKKNRENGKSWDKNLKVETGSYRFVEKNL